MTAQLVDRLGRVLAEFTAYTIEEIRARVRVEWLPVLAEGCSIRVSQFSAASDWTLLE